MARKPIICPLTDEPCGRPDCSVRICKREEFEAPKRKEAEVKDYWRRKLDEL